MNEIMEPVYLTMKDFRDIYKVYACFGDNGKTRLFADVVRCNDKDNYLEADIDAYLIMINPGSCKPANKAQKLTGYRFYKDFYVVEARSDMAQKCVMSLMETCHINKIRILNLSDVVNGNLKSAIEEIGEDISKSIFSKERETERKAIMPNDAVCIIAWGVDNKLLEYKKQAYESIGKDRIIGIQSNANEYAYRYIKPWKVEEQKDVIYRIAKAYNDYKSHDE